MFILCCICLIFIIRCTPENVGWEEHAQLVRSMTFSRNRHRGKLSRVQPMPDHAFVHRKPEQRAPQPTFDFRHAAPLPTLFTTLNTESKTPHIEVKLSEPPESRPSESSTIAPSTRSSESRPSTVSADSRTSCASYLGSQHAHTPTPCHEQVDFLQPAGRRQPRRHTVGDHATGSQMRAPLSAGRARSQSPSPNARFRSPALEGLRSAASEDRPQSSPQPGLCYTGSTLRGTARANSNLPTLPQYLRNSIRAHSEDPPPWRSPR